MAIDLVWRRLFVAQLENEDHSELRPQPIGNSVGDLCRRLVWDWEHRTDVDLPKHVAVSEFGGPRIKSASQIIGRLRRGISSKEVSCDVHSSSINRRKRWKRRSALEV